MIKLPHMISEMRKITLPLHDFYVSPDVMENHSDDSKSVSSI